MFNLLLLPNAGTALPLELIPYYSTCSFYNLLIAYLGTIILYFYNLLIAYLGTTILYFYNLLTAYLGTTVL
jgi:hypothetical protein